MRIRYPKLMCLGLLVAVQASAAEGFFEQAHIRAGASVGQLSIDSNKLAGFNETSTAWNLFAGFEFNRYLAVEVARLEGGKAFAEYSISSSVFETDEVRSHGVVGSAVGSWPINDMISVYGRGGLLNWRTTTRIKSNGVIVATGNDKGSDPFYGLGIGINVDSGMIRIEYDLSSAGAKVGSTKYDADVSLLSIGVLWRFGL